MKKFKGMLYPHWSMGTQYPIEFFLNTRYTFVYVPLWIFHFFYLLEFIVLQFLLWPLQIVNSLDCCGVHRKIIIILLDQFLMQVG